MPSIDSVDLYVRRKLGSHLTKTGGATPVGSGHCQFNEGVGGSFGATHPVASSHQTDGSCLSAANLLCSVYK
jgi:hypothetical protein